MYSAGLDGTSGSAVLVLLLLLLPSAPLLLAEATMLALLAPLTPLPAAGLLLVEEAVQATIYSCHAPDGVRQDQSFFWFIRQAAESASSVASGQLGMLQRVDATHRALLHRAESWGQQCDGSYVVSRQHLCHTS